MEVPTVEYAVFMAMYKAMLAQSNSLLERAILAPMPYVMAHNPENMVTVCQTVTIDPLYPDYPFTLYLCVEMPIR